MSFIPTSHTVLGTLVDRALCMPYAKPTRLARGISMDTNTLIADEVDQAAAFLLEALQDPDAAEAWSRAELSVDPGGPWWAKALSDYLGLSQREQDWVRSRLQLVASRAGAAVQEAATTEAWSWLWSQPPLLAPRSGHESRPRIVRPDLVAGLKGDRCLLVDLKTRGRAEAVPRGETRYGQTRAFQEWAKLLRASGHEAKEAWVLAVSSRGRVADGDAAYLWDEHSLRSRSRP